MPKGCSVSPSQVLQPLEDDLCYANLNLQQPRSSPGSSRKKASTKTLPSAQAAQAEVEYVTMVCPLGGLRGAGGQGRILAGLA